MVAQVAELFLSRKGKQSFQWGASLPCHVCGVSQASSPTPILPFLCLLSIYSSRSLLTKANLCALGHVMASLSLGPRPPPPPCNMGHLLGSYEYPVRFNLAVPSTGLTQGRCQVSKPRVPSQVWSCPRVSGLVLNASHRLSGRNLRAPGTEYYFYLHFVKQGN